jgi:hypothetical protein
MAKWPDVPSVFGWLSLDLRGNWLIKGQRISNPLLSEFIGRNYAADAAGRWFFQNGPQRVFVALAYTPLVLRTCREASATFLAAHTGAWVRALRGAWLDEAGRLLVESALGVGVVADRDLPEVITWLADEAGNPLDADRLEAAVLAGTAPEGTFLRYGGEQQVPVLTIRSADVPRRFGFDPDPRPAPGEPDC